MGMPTHRLTHHCLYTTPPTYRVQEVDARLEQLAQAKSHSDHERMKVWHLSTFSNYTVSQR